MHFHLRSGLILTVAILCAAPVAAEEVVHDFRGAKFDQDLLRFDGPDAHKFYTPEPEGLRVRLGDGTFPRGTVGVAWKATVRGDFTATAHYEVLESQPVKSGFGTAVEMYLYLDTVPKEGQSRDGIAFVRRLWPGQGLVFHFCRRTYDDAGQRVSQDAAQAPGNPERQRGRLRLARQGPTLIASFAEGDDGPWQELQRTDIGAVNVRMVRVAGLGNGRLDARLLEMRLETPGKPIVAEPPGAPEPEQTPPGQRIFWFLWGIGGAVVLFLVVFAVLRWKRSHAAATPGAADAHASAGMIGLVCSACGKNLKVKEESAGKRVKCPGCGQLMHVPALELGEPGA